MRQSGGMSKEACMRRQRIIFAKERQEVARELGLSVQQVRWAEESAIKKLRTSEALRISLKEKLEAETFDGTHDAPRVTA